MAILDRSTIQERIRNPKNSKALKSSKQHEERLAFHVEPVLDAKDANAANTKFLKQVEDFLPAEKYTRFHQLFQYPVPTNELTDAIFSELRRSINGEGGVRQMEFAGDSQEQKFTQYLEEINHDDFWQNEAWDAFKTSIHSVLIVDQPNEQTTPPRPYCYLLNIKDVIDMDVSGKDKPCEYIIFRDCDLDGVVYVFDDVYYRTYQKAENGEYILIPESEIEHNVGYCPAKPFWSTNLNQGDNIQKQGAITKSLSQLDKVLFWETSIEYYNTYGVFPVVWAYEQKTDEDNSLSSDHFDTDTMGGVELPLTAHHPAWIDERGKRQGASPNKGKSLLGAGSFVEVPAPADNQDADLRDPFGYLQIQVDSLEFADKYLQKRKDLVFQYCVGKGAEPENNQAKNEKQVESAFESKKNILEWIADNFDVAETWVLETKARIIFGADSVVGIHVKRGRRFYLQTPHELSSQYGDEKKAGLPMYIIGETRRMITETKYRGNADMLARMQILEDLEPYPDLSMEEVMQFANSLDPMLVVLKLNFDSLIRKFEREELPLVRFGSLTSYKKKLQSITDTLLGYIKVNEIKEPVKEEEN